MQFGEFFTWEESSKLMSQAASAGINFIDTAEMYPVPQCKETQGISEKFVGAWLQGRKREDFVVMTKVAGPGAMSWLRGGPLSSDSHNIEAALDASLARLQTDYIDVVLLHWPDRRAPP